MNQRLTAMAQRIPELEASAEPLECVVTAPEDEGHAAPPRNLINPLGGAGSFSNFATSIKLAAKLLVVNTQT
jgi:hypothetical protein